MDTLLTIAIPTYNRQPYLGRLLAVLADMIGDADGRVELLVSDNASEDGTADLVADFAQRHPATRTIRNATNIGPDANIEQCFRMAQGRWVWILGDDDMPKTGALAAVLAVLAAHEPDIVYLPSEWRPDVVDPAQGSPYDPEAFDLQDRLAFAYRVNVWLTFLSGIVVRRSHGEAEDFRPLDGTNLVQLGWVLPALEEGTRFCAFRDVPLLATAGNAGGYSVVKVFGGNLSRIVADRFGRGSPVYRALVGRTVATYLPQLIWNIRTGTGGRFSTDLPWTDLRAELGGVAGYWAFLVPIGKAPLPLARGVLLASRVMGKLRRLVGR